MIRIESLQINQDVLNLIAEIDEFKGAWRALGTLAPERLSALRRVATIESIGSGIGQALDAFTPDECAAYLKNSGYST